MQRSVTCALLFMFYVTKNIAFSVDNLYLYFLQKVMEEKCGHLTQARLLNC